MKKIFDFKRITNKLLYAPIILLPFLMYLLIYFVIRVFVLPLPGEFHIVLISVPLLFLLFFVGAVVEETGYMGCAIGPLQDRFGALTASILIGVSSAVWHFPSIIQQGHGFSWIAWGNSRNSCRQSFDCLIFNNTGKSLFACILFHTMLNIGKPLFPRDEVHIPSVDCPDIYYSVIAVIAIIVVFL